MIGFLPHSLNVNGKEIPIKTDFRIALIIFQAMNDPDLSNWEKMFILLDALYGIENIKKDDAEEAIKQANWFLDGGNNYKQKKKQPKLIDWSQDEAMIFSAVNKVANKETRSCRYIHWWTWLGYFMEIGEGQLSEVILIRGKKAKGKKLTKIEQEFASEHPELVNIKSKFSSEEKEEIESIKQKFNLK